VDVLVTEGYSMANGARFLKRVIDDRIKLPLSQKWKEASSFRATVKDGVIVVEPMTPRLAKKSA
jgi:ATP-dependent Clp protease ATP-binding subunit ClpC